MNKQSLSLEWINSFQQAVKQDQEFLWIAKHMNCTFLWKVGSESFLFKIEQGNILSITSPTWNDSWDFSIEGTQEAWNKFLKQPPPPLYNDLLGMVTRLPECELNGNRLMAMQYMRSLTRLFTIAREVQGDVKI
ncbi:hypothetical protein [Halalkalibacter oceani]|uniref:hypothetical protein n=1 Tax=Halalkalibacter oceani TaxID=1653776 RepID=UPI0033935D33